MAFLSVVFTCPTVTRIQGPNLTTNLHGLNGCAYGAVLFDSGHPIVLAGDFSVVLTDEDIYNPRSWLKDALLQQKPRLL
jgi:hypothetical protein